MGLLQTWALFALLLAATSVAATGSGQVPRPSLYQSPRFRWWWPGGWIAPDEVVHEITSIIEAGFGGGEISDVEDSVKVQLDPKIYGWGQDRWNQGVLSAYRQGDQLGGHVDLTLGPHWPTGFPGYTPDSPETSKELVHGQVFIQAGQTYAGPLPLPIAAPSGNETGNPNVAATPFLNVVVVAKSSSANQTASVVKFDPSTVQVITHLASNGTISWTAPNDGTYILVAAYARGTGQIQNLYDGNPNAPKVTDPFPAYIVDHFSSAGVEAGVKYWDDNILQPELRSLLQKSEGSIFEDSLELKLKQYWTLNMLTEFEKRRGYDLSPLILYIIKDTNTFEGDATVSRQITNDFYQTVSDLYIDYRVGGLAQWAHSIGLKLRIQPYTASFDSAYAASVLDIPEGESLGFQGDNDAFRVLAAGRDLGGKTTILSDELGAYMGKAYGVTWKFILGTANLDMSLGVSQVVIHGHPYRDSPSSVWPGFAPFTPLGANSNGFADAWGERQPQWAYAKNASLYLANAQKILQDGGPSTDIAVLNQDWGVTASWDDASLNDAGFSYQFPSPELLSKSRATVTGSRLAQPQYKSLVVNNETSMDLSTAQLLLSYGSNGLPIVWVSPLPTSTYSYSPNASRDDAELTAVLSRILRLQTTKQVDSTSEVPAALHALGVKPSVQYAQGVNNTLITLRRTYGPGFLYWIYNNGDSTVSEPIQLQGEGQPLTIDLFTGNVNPIAAFTSNEGYISLNISVAATSSVAILLSESNPFNAPVLQKYITSTDCNSFIESGHTIHLFSNNSCSAITSTGKALSLVPKDMPAAVSPTTWNLNVEDWSPANVNETGLNSSLTKKTQLCPIVLQTLLPWPNITSLATASGIGVYSTNVTLSIPSERHELRVLFSAGAVEGSWGLKINQVEVPGVNWFQDTDIDVTEFVRNGINSLEITVATTLWNKLRYTWPAIYGSLEVQPIGLTGPVVFRFAQEITLQ